MGNIIDFNFARDEAKLKKEERENVAEVLSKPMNALLKQMFRQQFSEMSDSVLGIVPSETEDGGFILPENDRVQLYKDLRDQLYDTAVAMDYVIETIEEEGE